MSDSEKPALTILGGPMAGTQFVLQEAVDNVLIGADPSCGFCLPLPGVSPIHARLWVDPNGVTVYDTGSPRGLYVNDDRVVGQTVLHNGDILWLGAPGDTDVVMIQCRIPQRPEAAETAATGGEPETVALPPSAITPPAEVAPPPPASEFEIVTEPVAPWSPPPPPSPAPSEFEVVAPMEPPTPAPFVPPPPPAPATPATLPPVPAFFEDETLAQAPRPVPPQPVPPPVAAPPPPPAPATAPHRPQQQPDAAVAPPPRPIAARPAAPAPKPAAPRPAPPPSRPAVPRPAPHPPTPIAAPPPASRGGSTGLYLGLAAVALIVIGGGGFAAWKYLGAKPEIAASVQPTPLPPTTLPTAIASPTPEETVPPGPVPTAVATPIVEAATPKPTPPPAPTPAPSAKPSASPTPSPKATPKATPTARPTVAAPSAEALKAQQVANLLSQAESARANGQYDVAVSRFDEALKLDPGNAQASAERAAALGFATALKRAFQSGRTSVQSGKGGGKKVSGFDSDDVKVAQATDYSGRIDFEVSPSRVKPGDSYLVKVFLVNDGKKDFKIASLSVVTTANGAKTGGGPVAPPAKDIAPQQRVALQEYPGVWQEGVNTWNMEVSITTGRGDTFKNQLVWR